ncbi:MAG TPA: zf-HC2 domain-containing protein [Candidatus Sulfopaludibacter sp.]|nr:zf-HC2 domain-containing protein [Candidatus Sulfopaludibacter sp.]
MPECRAFLRALGDYLDNTIEADVLVSLEGHLDCCPRCRILYTTTRRTLELYRNAPCRELPTEVESRLFAALESRLDPQCSDRARPRPV